MKCADPVLCYKGKYRHYSLASPAFKALHTLVFDCGKCIFCRKKKATELAMRCVLHASLSPQNCFLTLTYDEKHPSYHNNLDYTDIQKFKKSLRRHCDYHFKKKIQIFNVHEYGKNGKKHWHLVVFNHDFSEVPKKKDASYERKLFTVSNGNPLYTSKTLSDLWSYPHSGIPIGHCLIGSVSEASAMYQAQYTQKDLVNGNMTNSKKSKSNHSGIGKEYFLNNYEQILSLGYIPFSGRKVPIPRYFYKIAHKHYSHFNEPSNFFDLPDRKALYRPFNSREIPNKKMADLFMHYTLIRNEKIDELIQDWHDFIELELFSQNKPDFKKSEENYLYDKQNQLNKELF